MKHLNEEEKIDYRWVLYLEFGLTILAFMGLFTGDRIMIVIGFLELSFVLSL